MLFSERWSVRSPSWMADARLCADTARIALPHSLGSGARANIARNISLLSPNASVARKFCSSQRPTNSQTETSSLLAQKRFRYENGPGPLRHDWFRLPARFVFRFENSTYTKISPVCLIVLTVDAAVTWKAENRGGLLPVWFLRRRGWGDDVPQCPSPPCRCAGGWPLGPARLRSISLFLQRVTSICEPHEKVEEYCVRWRHRSLGHKIGLAG